jgi:serine/threonine protein kinase
VDEIDSKDVVILDDLETTKPDGPPPVDFDELITNKFPKKPSEPAITDSLRLPNGTKVGRYLLRQIVGKGGMGVVYVAYDPVLNRRLAIKILKPSQEGDDIETAKQRLLREAQAMAQIEHPNLVQVFDVGTFEDLVFIAMEFVEGRTLREWKAELDPANDWQDIIHVYSAAARALQAAHDVGLVHRDFKPDNVMLGFDNRVRVMDFGLAQPATRGLPRVTEESRISDLMTKPLTKTGMIMGTPAYMAPEQFIGEHADQAADQFSFCVALFEALYGYRPFAGKKMTEVAKSVLRGHIRLPDQTNVPDWVLDVLLKGLQTNPSDRYETIEELCEALKGPPRKETQHPWMLYIVMSLLTVAGVAFYGYSNKQLHDYQEEKDLRLAQISILEAKVKELDEMPKMPPPPEGLVDPEDVDELIRAHNVDVVLCRNYGDKPLDGTVELDVTVDANGVPEKVVVFRNMTVDDKVGRCLAGMVMNWTFPEPQKGRAQFLVPVPVYKPKK